MCEGSKQFIRKEKVKTIKEILDFNKGNIVSIEGLKDDFIVYYKKQKKRRLNKNNGKNSTRLYR